MDPLILGAIGLVLMIVMLLSGLQTAVVFFMMGFIGLIVLKGWPVAIAACMYIPFDRINSFDWVVIPLFIMMGIVLVEAGIGEDIFTALRAWLGHFKGGLASASSVACALIGTMTGSGFAASASWCRRINSTVVGEQHTA